MSPGIAPPENRLTGNASSSALSFAVGFYFAFRPFIVLLSVRIMRMHPQTGTGINLALNFAFLVMTAFCCLGQPVYPFGRILRIASVRWALLFLGFSCFSLSWSGTASIYVSMAYWCGMAADFAIVALMMRARSVTEVAAALMKGYIWGGCVGGTIAWILPSQSDLRLGDEELLGPNSIGYICAIALLFAQLLMRKKERGFIAPAFLLALTVLRCLSKTTIVALLLCEALLLTTDATMKRRTKVLLIVVATFVIVAFSSLLTSYFDIYTNAGNQSETLSGRLGIWTYFVTEAFQQPWFGHGFDSVWKVVPPFGPEQFEAPHAHNELLQQFYAYGVMGICMFAGIYTSLYRQIRRLVTVPTKHFFFALLLFVLVRGLAESERFDLSLPLWAVLIVSALVEHERRGRDPSYVLAGFGQSPWGEYPASQSMIREGWDRECLD
jgi:exopolysaccharide production protein ExoQ